MDILLLGAQKSGKTSIQRVVFQKMSPHETFFLTPTNKVEATCKTHINQLSIIYSNWQQPIHTVHNQGLPRDIRPQRDVSLGCPGHQELWLYHIRNRCTAIGLWGLLCQVQRHHQDMLCNQQEHLIRGLYSQGRYWHVPLWRTKARLPQWYTREHEAVAQWHKSLGVSFILSYIYLRPYHLWGALKGDSEVTASGWFHQHHDRQPDPLKQDREGFPLRRDQQDLHRDRQ